VTISILEKPSIVKLREKADRSLAELEKQILRDLEFLEYPAKSWLPKTEGPQGAHVYDVVVVGAGHCGVTAAFALLREKVTNILVIEKSPEGSEGPWQTYARMPDLRTRKNVTGNELGYPNLTFRAYYEAREGIEAYAQLQRISCDEWTCYLLWLRRFLKIPVQNDTELERISPQGKIFCLTTKHAGHPKQIYARRVVMTTGPLSMGGSNIPEEIRQTIPATHYISAYDEYDFSRLKNKRVVVVGAGASAFDNAGEAVENGAAHVDLIMRRPKIPPVSVIRWTDWSGFLQTYADLGDEQKWKLMHQVQRNAAPPTPRALKRVDGKSNFAIHFNSPIQSVRMVGDKVELTTGSGKIETDFIVLATGFSFDLKKSKPLTEIVGQIAVWRDKYQPPGGGSEKYLNSPYLGRNYEFVEKSPGQAPWLKHIYCYNQSSTLSMGPTGRVSGLKYGIKRLMVGICGGFMREDFEHHLASVTAYNANEFEGHPWVGEP